MTTIFNTSFDYPMMHVWCKFLVTSYHANKAKFTDGRTDRQIVYHPQIVKNGGQNGGTSISPNIEGVPSPGVQYFATDKPCDVMTGPHYWPFVKGLICTPDKLLK